MALYSEDLKSKVRATYEANNISFAKVKEMFNEIPSHKTIESWAKADKEKGKPWQKNRYSSLDEAIATIVDANMDSLAEQAADALKEKLVPATLVEDDAYMSQLGKETGKRVLSKKNYLEMMDENLMEAYEIARASGHINTKATFQMMAKSVVETKYGKNINLTATTGSDMFEGEALAGKSQAELIEMMNDLEDK